MTVPPPAVPDILLNVLHRPQYTPKNLGMLAYTHGGPKPLCAATTSAELLTHSKAFQEITTFSHKMREVPLPLPVSSTLSSSRSAPQLHITTGVAEFRHPEEVHPRRRIEKEVDDRDDRDGSHSRSTSLHAGVSCDGEEGSHSGMGRRISRVAVEDENQRQSSNMNNYETSVSRQRKYPIPSEPPHPVAASSLPGDAMTLYTTNIEYYNALVGLQEQLEAADQSIASLQDQLNTCCQEYVPPRNFLPPGFYEEHKSVIDAVNDYYVLYRVATAQQLLRRRAESNRGSGLDLYGASDYTDEYGNLIASAVSVSNVDVAEMKEEMLNPRGGVGGGAATNKYLRERLADLTAKIRVQQQRMQR